MAIRRLYNMLDKIGNNGSVRADEIGIEEKRRTQAKPNEASSLKRAEVLLVNSVSGAMIMVDGQIIPAGQATDQPFRVGDFVWAMNVNDGGWVILGSA